jgi:hypothetical protein
MNNRLVSAAIVAALSAAAFIRQPRHRAVISKR